MRYTNFLICFLLGSFSISVGAAQDLVDLIPGLYGGDGIQLGTASGAGIPTHQPNFRIPSQSMMMGLNRRIASEIQPQPMASSAGGVTYKFDPVSGTYTETSTTLGPIFAERPQTLGKGKFSTAISFSYNSYDRLEGQNLDRFSEIAKHTSDVVGNPNIRESFELDSIGITSDINLDVAAIVFSGTYGVTDQFDLGISIPVVYVSLDISSSARVISSSQNPFSQINPVSGRRFTPFHRFSNAADRSTDSASGNAVGLGDVLLSAKYYVLDREQFDVSGALQIKLPSGDQNDFLGTGSTTIRPFLIAAGDISELVRVHINVGYKFDIGKGDQDNLNYAVGFEVGNQTITGVFDFLGSNEMSGDGMGDDIYDASVGFKWRALDNLIVTGNVLIPLNSQGLRSDFIGLIAFEYRNWEP